MDKFTRDLEERLETVRSLREKVNILNDIPDYLFEENVKTVLRLCEESLDLSKKISYPEGTALALVNRGKCHRARKHTRKAMEAFRESLFLCRKHRLLHVESVTLSEIGHLYWQNREYDLALDYHFNSLDIVRKINDKKIRSTTEKISKLRKDKNEMFQMVNDLKGSLSVMKNLSKLVQQNIEEMSKEQVFHLSYLIESNTRQLLTVINNFDQSSQATEEIRISPKNVDVLEIVTEVIASYQQVAEEKMINLHIEVPSKKVIFSTDSKAITQILHNLLSNAIFYTPYGKSVFFRVFEKAEEMIIEIEDEGEGIPKDKQREIFSQYNRLNTMDSDQLQAVGLGLSIVKKLVEALRGSIHVESNPGRGSTFSMQLPKGLQ